MSLLLLVLVVALPLAPASELWAQNATGVITGTVTDSVAGDPIPGANVVVVGTLMGSSVGPDGTYMITNVPVGTHDLEASFVGYAPAVARGVEVTEGETTTVDLVMASSEVGLDELVVVGYGTQRRRDVTGAISSVSAEDFNRGISSAPEQLMQGKVAGVNIVESSGRPGTSSLVRVRGSSSISAGNDPLYVIDGVPVQTAGPANYIGINTPGAGSTSPFGSMPSNPLNTLNPADIKSIDVLKDASATAIYGSRGANGVIMITTKDFTGSASTINYDSYVGMSSVRETLPFLSREGYVAYAEANDLAYPDEGASTAWQDEVFRTAVSQNHNLAFGGTAGATSYRASFGYMNQEGIVLDSELDKYSGRINATHVAIDDRLRVDLNLTAARVVNNDVAVSSNIFNEGGNAIKDALRWAPTLPVRNEDGSYYQIGELRVNPVSWQQLDDLQERNNLIGNVDASYQLFEPLSISLNFGHTNEFIDRNNYIPLNHPVGANQNGLASINKVRNTSTLLEADLTYSDAITENSRMTALAGYSFQRFVVESNFTSANQFPSDATRWDLIQAGNTLSNTSSESANSLMSVYGRVNYQLMDRYLLTLTLRNDGSSRFGENNRWALFPSGSVAWILTEEAFFPTEAISNLKLRLGYGVTGNQEIPNYLFMEQLAIAGSATYPLGGQAIPSVLPSNFPNPDLQWEETSQLNVGVDFGILDGRLSGAVDYYVKRTTDLLLQFQTAAPSVVETQWANVGEIENRGIEFALDGLILSGTDLQWDVSANLSANRNELVSLSNEQYSRDFFRTGAMSGVVSPGGNTQIIQPGLPLYTFWGRQFTGLDGNGMETYLDADGDGEADLVAIGDPHPDFTYGFSSSVWWKNFDASVMLRGVVGNDIFNNTAAEFSYLNGLPGINVLESALDSGVSPGQTAQFSSRWIEDGSYLRLAHLTLGYTFDNPTIAYLSRARLYLTGQNLFVLTDYSGFDPEVQTNTQGGGTAPVGIDYLVYPRPRSFQLGVSLDF